MNYKEYLQSDKWKKLRAEARKKAKKKCELCGGEPKNVHHVKYPKCLENDCLDNLLVVCKKCHNKLHGIKDEKLQLMKVIEKRINWDKNNYFDEDFNPIYIGFNMSKTHSQEETNEQITKDNIKVLNLFEDYLDVNFISKHFDFWKGTGWWDLNGLEEESFGGETSKDILFWLIVNKGLYSEKNGDGISKV